MAVISICNNKGGVGKTTTSVNVATGLGALGHKVLLVDMDGQCNSNLFLTGKKIFSPNILNLMLDFNGELNIFDCIVRPKSQYKNVYLLPADERLANLKEILNEEIQPQVSLKEVIDQIREDWDFIIIDCPPAMDMSSINALCASDYFIIMRDMNYLSKAGESKIIDAAKKISKSLNPKLKMAGCVLSKVQKENATNVKIIVNDFKEETKDYLVNARIPHSAYFDNDNPNKFEPIYKLASKQSKIYKSYIKLTEQVSELK